MTCPHPNTDKSLSPLFEGICPRCEVEMERQADHGLCPCCGARMSITSDTVTVHLQVENVVLDGKPLGDDAVTKFIRKLDDDDL